MAYTVDDVTRAVQALLDADEAVKSCEKELKAAKERATIIREETIPGMMQELGLESLTLSTGQRLKIEQDVYASIPNANKRSAYQWLDDNGFGGLIKLDVDIAFGKGEKEQAVALFRELVNERGLSGNLTENVHAQTLKAFLREQLAKGTNIPLDLFGARPVLTTKISKK